MTDDIVTRLKWLGCKYDHSCITCEAADEIERLRKELLEAQKDLGLLRRARDRRDDDIKRLEQLLFQEIYYGQEKSDKIEDLQEELAELQRQYKALKLASNG